MPCMYINNCIQIKRKRNGFPVESNKSPQKKIKTAPHRFSYLSLSETKQTIKNKRQKVTAVRFHFFRHPNRATKQRVNKIPQTRESNIPNKQLNPQMEILI